MNPTMILTEQHVHLDLDLDVEHQFHYRSRVRDGHRVVLHRGDAITFTCGDEFSIRFVGSSPFEEAVPGSHRLLLTFHVRSDAPYGAYRYVLELMKNGESFTDPGGGDAARDNPQILIEPGA